MQPSRRRLAAPELHVCTLIADLTAELHDTRPDWNASRALAIWRRSALGYADFVRCIYAARERARRNYRVTKRAAGALGELGARNRMPYLLAVLETLARDWSVQAID